MNRLKWDILYEESLHFLGAFHLQVKYAIFVYSIYYDNCQYNFDIQDLKEKYSYNNLLSYLLTHFASK